MVGLTYSRKFDEHINELHSPQNISKHREEIQKSTRRRTSHLMYSGNSRRFLVPKEENLGQQNPEPPKGR